MEQLARVGRSRRADAERSARAGLHLPRAAQLVLRQTVEAGPLRISDLARSLEMSDAAASRTVTVLEAEGLIERVASPDDGRVALARITARGRRVQRRLREVQDEIFAGYLSGWSARDLATLADFIERLAGDLRRPERGAPEKERAAGARR